VIAGAVQQAIAGRDFDELDIDARDFDDEFELDAREPRVKPRPAGRAGKARPAARPAARRPSTGRRIGRASLRAGKAVAGEAAGGIGTAAGGAIVSAIQNRLSGRDFEDFVDELEARDLEDMEDLMQREFEDAYAQREFDEDLEARWLKLAKMGARVAKKAGRRLLSSSF